MKWINDNLEKIALSFIIFAVLWIVFGPILVTSYSIVNFAGDNNNTGQIGDTIGGITSPVVGLISIVLLYFTLIKQIESNKSNVSEANFRIINEEVSILKKSVDQYSFAGHGGKNAIYSFATTIGENHIAGQLGEDQYEIVDRFHNLLYQFNKILYLLDNLKTSNEYKDFLSKDLQQIYVLNFQSTLGYMTQKWVVSEKDAPNLVNGKMFAVKGNLQEIAKEIAKRNKKP
jgi:hypothetical protein